jgi:hypothetical protein
VLWREKALVAQLGEELKKQFVKTSGVEHPDWFGMQSQLQPGEYLNHFFQSADAAGERDEGVSEFRHLVLPFMHCLDDDKLCESSVITFLRNHRPWDNADHFAAGRESGIRNNAHQADVSGSVNDGETTTRAAPKSSAKTRYSGTVPKHEPQ